MNKKQNDPWLFDLESEKSAAKNTKKKNENDDDDLKPHPAPDTNESLHQGHESLPDNTFGLALSGGGIRSASFCLGIIQSLARADWLRRIDYLSTVSGGGYVGAFLGRFFDVSRDPDLVREALSDSRSQPVAWLRAHSNYLSPTGSSDAVFNLASFWRNFFTLHFILAIFAFAIFGAGNTIEYHPWRDSQHGVFQLVNSITEFLIPLAPISSSLFSDTPVVTPWSIGAEILFWLTVLPLALAYWIVSKDRYEDIIVPVLLATLVVVVAALLATMWVGSLAVFAAVVVWILYTWRSVKRNEGHGNLHSRLHMALARNYLTNLLAFWGAVTLGAIVLSIVDYLGKFVADSVLNDGQSWSVILGMSGGSVSMIALIPILRGLANYLAGREKERAGWIAWAASIPFVPTLTIVIIGGIVPLILVSFLSHMVFELGQAWWVGFGATVVALLVCFLLGRQSLISLVNLSGNLTVYSARLARVFLGAVNPRRHRHSGGMNVGQVIDGDDVPLHKYAPHEGGGPVHLINVAVNETVDIASQRGSRYRKAENMAVGPAGINLSRNYHAVWSGNQSRPSELNPIGDLTSPHPFLTETRGPVEVENLNLREWIAISGAAFSPGMGRNSSTATSLLYTLTNLRLGYWWNSGVGIRDRFRIHRKGGFIERIRDFLYAFLAPQALLVSELLGRFGGPWRRHWYLSDGGHFEVSGAYELLRRRVPYIIVADAGADKKNEGGVLAWLTRLARIDFDAEFHECRASDLADLNVPGHIAKHLGSMNEMLQGSDGEPEKHATLFRVDFPESNSGVDSWHGRKRSWVLYLKATTVGDEPADIRNYQCKNPDFPNEPTLDQFFDEQQWESYRKLGEWIGDKFFK